MIVLNLFGGPGTGKSTIASLVFSELKIKGYNPELVPEYAKKLTYKEDYQTLNNDQIYISANQLHGLRILENKVDVVIFDSPILLGYCYSNESNPYFKNLLIFEHNKYKNLNFYIQRQTLYNKEGRKENLQQAKEVDNRIIHMLEENNIDYQTIQIKKASQIIINKVIKKLEEDFYELDN